VEAQFAGRHGWDYATSTASDGSYAIFGLSTGDYKVRVTALGYAREYYDNVNPSFEATLVHVAAAQGTSGIDFDLTEGGSISGHVYQSDGLTPIGGARISVWPSKYVDDDGFHAYTTADGSYTVTGLALGPYKVLVEKPAGYARKYYGEVYCWPEALDVKVLPPDDTPDVDIRLDQSGSISGYVFRSDGSTPVSGAAIIADLSPSRHCKGFHTRSTMGGRYTIVNLPPGNYTVRIGGNIPNWYAGELYDSKYTWGTADRVTVTAGNDTSNINFTLDEGGAITGHVFDEETGEPISGIQLGAWLPDGDHVTPAPLSSYNGSYKFLLRPGSYLIKAGVGVRHAHGYSYVSEWYDNHYDFNNATLVNVTLHNETAGIDIYLAKPGSISGHVYEEDGVTPIAGASVYAFPTTGDHPGAGANSEPDSSYTIEGLPSGNYKIQATVSDHVPEYYDNAPDEASATEVTVNAPNDTPDIDFTLSPVSE
jgi:hypothetical protein